MLCQENSLLLERCYKIPKRCYMMVTFDQQFCSLKNKLDHVTLPLERRDKGNISSLVCHWIGRRWRGSHELYQGTSAHKDHHIALLLHKDVDCIIFSQFFTQEEIY